MATHAPVLVVDDDAVSRHVLAQALGGAGLATAVVTSGADALARLKHTLPSLVLLDLVMPPPDGFEVLRAIRSDPRTADVPVVVLTALDSDDDVARAFEMGADDFVRKPFRPVELVARIRGQLRMREYVEALARKEHDAKVVLELTQALSSTLDFRNILFTVVRRIAEVAKVDRCSIVLVRDKGDVGYVVAASDDKELRDLPIALGKYPEIQQVMQTGEPLVIEDAETHPLLHMVRDGMPQNGFRSLSLLPILFEDRPMGVLFLRGRQPLALREHELSLARTVANATAIALRNARILQSLRDQTQQITFARFEAEKRLKALQRYADFFHSTADGIVVIDADGDILFSNPRAHAITGRTEAELGTASLADLLDARDRLRLEEIHRGFARGVFPHMVDLTFARGDVFELSAERARSMLKGGPEYAAVDAIMDRAALVALLPADRERYVATLRSLLAVGGRILLETLEHDAGSGPPHSVDEAEVAALFGKSFSIEKLRDADITSESANITAKGAHFVREKVFGLIRNEDD